MEWISSELGAQLWPTLTGREGGGPSGEPPGGAADHFVILIDHNHREVQEEQGVHL